MFVNQWHVFGFFVDPATEWAMSVYTTSSIPPSMSTVAAMRRSLLLICGPLHEQTDGQTSGLLDRHMNGWLNRWLNHTDKKSLQGYVAAPHVHNVPAVLLLYKLPHFQILLLVFQLEKHVFFYGFIYIQIFGLFCVYVFFFECLWSISSSYFHIFNENDTKSNQFGLYIFFYLW